MLAQATEPIRDGVGDGIEVFRYAGTEAPDVPFWELWNAAEVARGEGEDRGDLCQQQGRIEAAGHQVCEARVAEEARRSFEAGRERGIQEGRAAERAGLATTLKTNDADRIEQAARLAEGFRAERQRYFEVVEREVVKLALAIAARILRREAQMDPLLLTGAVRVALGQLSASTQVRLRVPPSELDLWTESMALMPNLAVRPAVVAGEGMRLGDCVIETELGSVDLGVRAQLSEIEHGFFDRAGGQEAPIVARVAARVSEDMSE